MVWFLSLIGQPFWRYFKSNLENLVLKNFHQVTSLDESASLDSNPSAEQVDEFGKQQHGRTWARSDYRPMWLDRSEEKSLWKRQKGLEAMNLNCAVVPCHLHIESLSVINPNQGPLGPIDRRRDDEGGKMKQKRETD